MLQAFECTLSTSKTAIYPLFSSKRLQKTKHPKKEEIILVEKLMGKLAINMRLQNPNQSHLVGIIKCAYPRFISIAHALLELQLLDEQTLHERTVIEALK